MCVCLLSPIVIIDICLRAQVKVSQIKILTVVNMAKKEVASEVDLKCIRKPVFFI